MPELPEVESTRRHLEEPLVGRTVTSVQVGRPRMIRHQRIQSDFAGRLEGRKLTALDRIGKFLLARFAGDITLVLHLGMSGRIQLAAPDDELAPHSNVILGFDDRVDLRLIDPRTFGFAVALTPDELADHSVASLGPDALNALPRSKDLAAAIGHRTAPIKSLLLDQRIIAGLGNIYADEVLHRARVHGSRAGGSLKQPEVTRLRGAIGPVLAAGLRAGGTSLDDLAYLLPDGRAGEYLDRLRVYGREGLPCRTCGTPIERSIIGQRSHFSCKTCQT
ncbi:MAG: bifunctional DNA-formamidopyrimidine glycosylase/DNA-(apurinic or apyrimidinic site) lyase [Acidimicrobiia bacterium]|nr:bifunctional DNA-formamidopyrimidine glycosylase/DNA-(apurinic or apyrimidinic site) lyase [Acidimicrobiia bacterium]NNC43021.1 bifunctional DNA-formamidopyrimidine glycosylase/DNA-(apurinic or apyrimidinic site) lyase [Acidimicrobiia bacterium]NND13305.1 bifunctional DNA-formamidopyrimidine glycosylase/DNA-(apurinic or apyrimidinic site) lyase [Acidimicrobiia bacterium]